MFDRDFLAVAVLRLGHSVMPDMMADDFLRAGPMARAHLVRNGRLRLRGLILRRCSGSRRGGSLGEGRRTQAESGDGGGRQDKLMHDVLLGGAHTSSSSLLRHSCNRFGGSILITIFPCT